ncbi:uncharacterized protein YlxW (UPF0749 family) [Peribacillus deserti]|uniref:Uncharacterized protein YlxW (UPF0749 family) n=1 Tax=Peribacillus deserti TaxID=673318 RepID=A0ABS2QGS1_9BACI|nr:DUF881 domain-containing protein [Peribacillus deserti]MBM7692358.1 uncharacterized protein YlxW (UPF0749 family) [Peribacillus deserti]
MKVKSKHFVLSLIGLVLGFMIAFSYNLTKDKIEQPKLSNKSWDRDFQLRENLVEQEEKTRKLQKELFSRQEEVTSMEKQLSKEAHNYSEITKEMDKYRMYLGKVKVKGKGLEVTLADGDYNSSGDVNNYIVHEQHIFKVVNELYASGAQAVAINGQRLTRQSYIVCNGPVITIDGTQHPAPFVVSAIGDPDVLEAAVNISGGVMEQLVNENIIFSVEKMEEIIMEPVLGSK